MKPRSLDEIRRLATSRGAKLDIDGRTFNAEMTRARAAAPRVVAPEPVKAAEPERAKPDNSVADAMKAGHELVASVAESISRDNVKTVEAIERVLTVSATPKPKSSWKLSVKRDGEGRIYEVIATPIKE